MNMRKEQKEISAERFRANDEIADEESETLSDIDDAEFDGYLLNKKETRFKTMIWEKINKEYLQDEADKEAIAAAERRSRDGILSNSCSDDVQAAFIRAMANLKAKKEKTRKQGTDIAKRPSAAVVAPAQILAKKRPLSSKINYDALDKLFDDSEIEDKSKRSRTETENEKNDDAFSKEDDLEENDMGGEEEDVNTGGILYEDYDDIADEDDEDLE